MQYQGQKLADIISDAILDAHLELDPHSDVKIDTMLIGRLVLIVGELCTFAKVDIENIARRVLARCTHDRDGYTIITSIDRMGYSIYFNWLHAHPEHLEVVQANAGPRQNPSWLPPVGICGKCPRHIVRSGTYLARYMANNVVAAELADSCRVQLVFVPCQTDYASLYVKCDAAKVPQARIETAIRRLFPQSLEGMIEMLELRKPIYEKAAKYGHLHPSLPWERTDRVRYLLAET